MPRTARAVPSALLLALPFLFAACRSGPAVPAAGGETAAWAARAQRVTITRDTWGIPHIRARTDADAVFGLMYAQAEDDFPRIERNFLRSLGREAEADGEPAIWSDLRMRLFIDPDELRGEFERSPRWLQDLMTAWADGLNWYLHTHPDVRPLVLTRFEPWMALSFSEGSIGGDIESVSLARIEAFYGGKPMAAAEPDPRHASEPPEPRGSNGIALAPSRTAAGRALLWINPHTSFYFRHEAHVTSDEGLDVYGALTWGQFFVYQGFNASCGWMHTSSGVDNIDEWLETVEKKASGLSYRHGEQWRRVQSRTVTIRYRTASGMAEREFPTHRTHHGPIIGAQDGRWIAVGLMEQPRQALMQSYLRTKARNLAEWKRVMELHTNSSNDTLFADAEGNIAYFHSNFVPRRDPAFDWTKPVDGSLPAADWQGVHRQDEGPSVENPENGWVMNTNNWPYSCAGGHSKPSDAFPAYYDRNGENPRGVHALQLLDNERRDWTLEGLIQAGFDRAQPEFDAQIPQLLAAFDALPAGDALRQRLGEPIEVLRAWDRRWGVDSVGQSLAVFWADELWRLSARDAERARVTVYAAMRNAAPERRLRALGTAVERLAADFGTWRTPWGEINRFQRLSGAIEPRHDDQAPSIPVGFASARWGSLASFGVRRPDGCRRLYGSSGNSFVAAVEFGPDGVRARAVTAGGLSGDPASCHFADQAVRYAEGDLREVWFDPRQLAGNIERIYRPGL